MRYPNAITIISAAMHLVVDGLCLCTLYLLSPVFETWNLIGIFMTYNILAFLTQPLTGHLADHSQQKHWMLLAAVLLLIAGVAVAAVTIHHGQYTSALGMLPTATLLGIGNSFFHTWGGKQVAMKTHNDIRALGVFVSTGAFGLAIGAVFCSWALLFAFLLILCGLAMTYLTIDFQNDASTTGTAGKWTDFRSTTKTTDGKGADEETHYATMVATMAIAILMLLVMLRSWVGDDFTTGIEKNDTLILAIGTVAMLGKMAGGWLSRWMGIVRAMVCVLVVVLACMLCHNSHFAIALAGLFAINCTMPVTLYLANVVLKDHEGLAFGLLAAALIVVLF
ncbi:MAG: MFS transporter [Prevotella sp.]|nr:MFS transporter [Prevotella sp.]